MVFSWKSPIRMWLLFLLCAAQIYGSGDPVSILITPVTESVKAVRYQTGIEQGDSWTGVGIPAPVLTLEGFESTNEVLYIQQSEDALTWSDTYEYRYDPAAKVWDISRDTGRGTSFIDTLEIKLYGLYPYGNSTACYSHLLGAGLKMDVALSHDGSLMGYSEFAYSRGPSESHWVEIMQSIDLSAGLGYRIPLGSRAQVSPELGYGVLIHLLDADFDEDGTSTLEVFIDQQVRLSLNLSIAMSDTTELFFGPLGVLFFEDGNIGTMVGGQSGIRIHF
jgi:hypothetical protein